MEDTGFTFTALLANDLHAASIRIVDPPLHGFASSTGYRPAPGYFGIDQFTFDAGDGTKPATVTVTVESGTIPYERSRLLASDNVDELEVGNIDGDGKLDLVGINYSNNEMVVFRNTSSGAGESRSSRTTSRAAIDRAASRRQMSTPTASSMC